MKRAPILAGTALALVMAAAQAQAAQPAAAMRTSEARVTAPVVLAQAEEQPTEEELRKRQREAEEGAQEEAPAAEEQPPAEEAPPAAEEAPPPPEEPAVEEPAPEPEAAPEPEPAPEPEAQPEPEPEAEPGLQFEEQAPTEEAEPAPAEEEPSEAPAEEPAMEEEPAAEPEQREEAPPAEEAPAPEVEEPAPTPEPAPTDEAPAEEPAQEEAPQRDEPGLQFEQDEPAPPEEPQPAPSDEDEPVMEDGEAAPDAEEPAPDAPSEPPAEGEAPPAEDDAAAPVDDEATGEEAPILDSQKEGEAAQPQPEGEQEEEGLTFEEEEAGPPPESDAEAQQLEEPVEIQSLRAEEGRRIERRDRRERREGVDVLREIGDRFVIQLNNQVVVQSDDRDRIGRDAQEVYYEELPRGLYRETVVRPNGVQVVTVRDRYGDVVRRSRIMPDGQEYVLVYTDRRDREEFREWRDPALDLPPLRLTIPREEYILDARRVEDEDVYYQFLDQPPVEPVRRLYTIDEVKYSARVRDSVRRVDLDTITFEFGSASISESEIPRLEGVATAMERLLEENPAETFLIEGHTDAVGSDEANLALSDRRAESVAEALTNVFAIPPENLVTQGYGETYLKIDTAEPARENRRVAIRRITPLVSPVASR